jgi:murein DD-endopeptidase MepM/ murein hydrolase activator NlpD
MPDQTAFGEPRERKRIHAGVDLEAPEGTPVLAMTDRVVLRVALFREGTYAIEVQHPGFGIVRYGELHRQTIRVSEGRYVKQGEIIGYL